LKSIRIHNPDFYYIVQAKELGTEWELEPEPHNFDVALSRENDAGVTAAPTPIL
jgi:hypothetical protein